MRRIAKELVVLYLMASLLSPTALFAAEMEHYCIVPPYVVQNVPPNVMLLVDNSENMYRFAHENIPNYSISIYTGSGTSTVKFPYPVVYGWSYEGYTVNVNYYPHNRFNVAGGNASDFAVGDYVYIQQRAQLVWNGGQLKWETVWPSDARYTGPKWPGVSSVLRIRSKSGSVIYLEKADGTDAQLACDYSIMMKAEDVIVYDTNDFDGYYPVDHSFSSGTTYYGYFNSNYWYSYGSNKFTPTAPKAGSGLAGARARDTASEWDGNFLNWLVMRRLDVLRKATTGGSVSAGKLEAVTMPSDKLQYGLYKRVSNAQNYVPSSFAASSGDRCFKFSTSGGQNFTISSSTADNNCMSGGWGSSAKCTQIEYPSGTTIQGVLQAVVGAKARLGVMTFTTSNEGAKVDVTTAGQSLSSAVNRINTSSFTAANINSPLGEGLWTAVGYHANKEGYNNAGQVFDATIRATGPEYSNLYGVTAGEDPFNYGTGGQPRYPKCAESYVMLITGSNPCLDSNLPAYIADYANGRSSFNCTGASCPGAGIFSADTIWSSSLKPWETMCTSGTGATAGLEDVALYMHTTDLRDTALGTPNINGDQKLTLYIVSAFGPGSNILKYAAINGGYVEGDGSPGPTSQSEWDADLNNVPDTYYQASASNLYEQLESAFNSLLKRAASGTAASVLASGEGSGANLVQAVFYPRRRLGDDVLQWTGTLHNFWYYVDPYFSWSSIREDTDGDRHLRLDYDPNTGVGDKVVELAFDENLQAARAYMYIDSDGDGAKDYAEDIGGDGQYLHDLDGDGQPETDSKPIEDISPLWEAADKLFLRDLGISPRTIWTNTTGAAPSPLIPLNSTATGMQAFVNTAAATFAPFMNTTDTNGNGSIADEAAAVIDWVHGIYNTPMYIAGFRNTVATVSNTTGVWKLADILNSTPKIVSFMPLNSYYEVYNDSTYGAEDVGGFVNSTTYRNRNAVFAGANDGMLHAFKMGKLEDTWTGQLDTEKARLTDTSGIGEEMWAFIPRNALPYLKWLTESDYCHIYTVDLSPYIFDASIGVDTAGVTQPAGCDETNYWRCRKTADSWRTVLIGGMRFGGACKATTDACSAPSNCVKNPANVGGGASGEIGYSAYFALDVTDPTTPRFMWEFSHPDLGFATTGPAIVRLNGLVYDSGTGTWSKDAGGLQANGRWLVVLGSGPTGPIDTVENQFLGQAGKTGAGGYDQKLRYFVLDLKTGQQVPGSPLGTRAGDPNISYAFSSSLINVVNDPDTNYEDNVLYSGYTTLDSGAGKWTKGGVIRIIVNDPTNQMDATNWKMAKVVDDVGPVTASVQTLQDNFYDKMWLYFGTGRYYYALEEDRGGQDDISGQRYLYGIKDPCYYGESSGQLFSNPGCTTMVATTGIGSTVLDSTDVANATAANMQGKDGWKVALDPAGDYTINGETYSFGAERVITDPVSSVSGIAYFTTYKPYDQECGLGGKSYLWALEYATGGDPGAKLKGTALIQVSTGSIEKVDLQKMFTEKGGRRSSSMEGVPPTAQGFSLFLTPPPDERVIHVQEK